MYRHAHYARSRFPLDRRAAADRLFASARAIANFKVSGRASATTAAAAVDFFSSNYHIRLIYQERTAAVDYCYIPTRAVVYCYTLIL